MAPLSMVSKENGQSLLYCHRRRIKEKVQQNFELYFHCERKNFIEKIEQYKNFFNSSLNFMYLNSCS